MYTCCNLTFLTKAGYKSHLRSKKHRKITPQQITVITNIPLKTSVFSREETIEKFEFSDEQLDIINETANNNIICNAVAGSGKTTTILGISQRYNDDNILLLTYNKRLKFETRERSKKLDIKNISVESYHSFCSKYHKIPCPNDEGLIYIVQNNIRPNINKPFTIIIIDEAQDMTFMFYKIILNIIKHNKVNARICILGDIRQTIYQYIGSCHGFLEYANEIFPDNGYPWKRLNLSISYRLTHETAIFVNSCLGNNTIKTIKSGNKPIYISCNLFKFKIQKYIFDLINEYKPQNTFILSASIAQNANKIRPIKLIANHLTYKKIPIFAAINDDDELNNEVIYGKAVISSFHQSKGLERDLVIILNFDNSYYKYYARNCDKTVCPNTLYVAMTRAKKQLVVISGDLNDKFDYVNIDHCKYIDFNDIDQNDDINVNIKPIERNVTGILRNINTENLSLLQEIIKYEIITKSGEKINIPSLSKQSKFNDIQLTEMISNINGIAIPAYFQYTLTGKSFLEIYDLEIKNYLIKATEHCALLSGYNFIKEQIENYNWLTQKIIDKCVERLNTLNISRNAIFEDKIYTNNLYNSICGVIDVHDGNTIYELKCVNVLSDIHILQLALYAYIIESRNAIIKNISIGDTIYIQKEDNKYSFEPKIIEKYVYPYINLKYDISCKKFYFDNGTFNKYILDHDIRNTYILYNILDDEKIQLNVTMKDLIKLLDKINDMKQNECEYNYDTFINEIKSIQNTF